MPKLKMIATLYQVVCLMWIAIEVTIALVTRTRTGKGEIHDRGSMLMLWIVIFGSITACECIRASAGPNLLGGAEWLLPASFALLVTGLLIRCAAIATLGKSFSPNVAIRKSQQLTRTGVYRFVRHPSYLGLLIIFFALGLHSRNWISLLALMVPATTALLYRIRIEEEVLRKAFGPEYIDYSRQTSCLVPGLF